MPSKALVWAGAVVLLAALPAFAAAQNAEKRVYVSVSDKTGAPIEGLTAEHFAVRESGKDRTVVQAEPLRIPMHVAVLVDTSAVSAATDQAFRKAVIDFVVQLAPFNHVALYSFGDRAAIASPFTQDQAQLRSAADRLFAWSHTRSLLIDAIDLALRDLEKIETPRPVIVVLTSESPEASGLSAGSVIKRLIAQSTALHAISLANATGSGSAAASSNDIPASSARLQRLAATGEGDRERTRVLQQGTSATGGSLQRVTTTLAAGPALTRLARDLSNGYLVTFARPGGDRMKDLQVGIMLEGVTLRATAAPFGTR